jgi:hypothetical protein
MLLSWAPSHIALAWPRAGLGSCLDKGWVDQQHQAHSFDFSLKPTTAWLVADHTISALPLAPLPALL